MPRPRRIKRKQQIKNYHQKKKVGYRSKFEARAAAFMIKHGIEFEYEKTLIDYIKLHTYKPDFRLPNGIYIETKGRFTSRDRTAHLLVRAQHPELDIRFVFMRDNKLNVKSISRYTDWCETHGIKYYVETDGSFPLEWAKEIK